ncbi:hypothetical protein [Bacillus salipaludis]|uniref:Uncharacterized protein n=1 Tax=Bacillus salipaludis TaxID=2547811 RepID=A0ABW8RH14_9BACI
MKKIGLGAAALSLLLGGGYSAFASSNEGPVEELLKGEVKTYEEGEMPKIPEGATMFTKEEVGSYDNHVWHI